MERKEVSAKDIQRISLEILEDVGEFCKKNNLTYWLAYGTLIGAIRHKGYIPWDDDIDIIMPRPDYDKFLDFYHSDKYDFFKPSDEGYDMFIVKICDRHTEIIQRTPMGAMPIGVHIDIFPLDGEPNDEDLFKKQMKRTMKLWWQMWGLRAFAHQQSNVFRRLLVYVYCNLRAKFTPPYTRMKIKQNIEKNAHKYSYATSKYVGCITGTSPYGQKERYDKSWFSDTVMVEFEGRSMPAPKGYNELLTHIYGDYMNLPPEDKRGGHSFRKVYWK